MKIGDRVVLLRCTEGMRVQVGDVGTLTDARYINETPRAEVLVHFDGCSHNTLVPGAWLRVLTAVDRLAQLGDAP